jgi:hydrogenase expression/formation protein HypE
MTADTTNQSTIAHATDEGRARECYPLGKLPPDHLARLFARRPVSDERVILGPGVGHDAAVISFDGRYLVAKTDPITFASEEIGWFAVHVNANDVACTGGTPRWFLVTLLLPEKRTDSALVDSIFDQVAGACTELGVELVGGHTEITHGLDHPVVIGCMLGEAPAGGLVRSDGARLGDAVLLSKGIALEGTAIIAREKYHLLDGFEAPFLDRCRRLLHDPGISVVRDAALAVQVGGVHAMHDPTEGGLATGLREMAEAAGVGMVLDAQSIPILPETARVCQRLQLDPLGLIASGSLLLTVAPDSADSILKKFAGEGIAAARIGTVVERQHGLSMHTANGRYPLPAFERDEIARLFDQEQ